MSDPHDPAGGKPPPRPALPRPGPPRPAPPRAAPGAQKTLLGGALDTSASAPTPNVGTTPRQGQGTLAFEAVPDHRERAEEPAVTQRTVAFEAAPDPSFKRQTAAFEALPADDAEARSQARKRKKGLSSTLAFGDEEIAATQREVERLRQEEAAARAEAQAAAGTGDRRTPTQFAPASAAAAVPTTPSAARHTPVQNLDRTVAFESAPETAPATAPRKKRTFGGTIAFGAMTDAEAAKPRAQTVAFDAMPERPASQPPKGGMASTMAFEAPPYRPEVAPAAAPEVASTDASARPRSARRSDLSSTVAFDPNDGRRAGGEELASTMAFESPLAGQGASAIVDDSSQIAVPEAQQATKRTMIGGIGFQPPTAAPAPGGASPTDAGLGPGGYPGSPPAAPSAGQPMPPEAGTTAEPFQHPAASTPPGFAGAPGAAPGGNVGTPEMAAHGTGMGAPGMGTPGMGAPGMGAPGMGAPGMGAPQGGYGAPPSPEGSGGFAPFAPPPDGSNVVAPFAGGPQPTAISPARPASSKKIALVIVAVVLFLGVVAALALWLTGVV